MIITKLPVPLVGHLPGIASSGEAGRSSALQSCQPSSRLQLRRTGVGERCWAIPGISLVIENRFPISCTNHREAVSLMATKDKKQKHAKKRKEIQRRKKARRISLPDLLRKEPLLEEVLNYGLTEADLEGIKSRGAEKGPPLIPCDLSLANTIVYGGIAWAEKWGFKLPKDYKIWLRLFEPVDKTGIDLSFFGMDGKPLLVLSEDGQDRFAGEYLYPEILKAKFEAGKDGIPRETLSLMGDIKSALITFSRQPEFSEELEAALKRQFGKPSCPDSEDEWIRFQDWFLLQYKLEEGETIAERFVENHKNSMSNDVRKLILGWAEVIEGLFEVKGRKGSSLFVKNLINEREYDVFPTASMDDLEVKSGDFLFARIVPAKGFHIFSGAVTIIEWDGSDDQRATMYKIAMDFQMKNPTAEMARLAHSAKEEPASIAGRFEPLQKERKNLVLASTAVGSITEISFCDTVLCLRMMLL
jgi:hypothetical protein